MGLQRQVHSLHPGKPVNFFSGPAFHHLQKVCDAFYRGLHTMGIGADLKATEVLTKDEEETLWKTGVLNTETPDGLLNAVFFLNGKNVCLRGGSEHRDLKFSQLKREVAHVNGKSMIRYAYTENGS